MWANRGEQWDGSDGRRRHCPARQSSAGGFGGPPPGGFGGQGGGFGGFAGGQGGQNADARATRVAELDEEVQLEVEFVAVPVTKTG